MHNKARLLLLAALILGTAVFFLARHSSAEQEDEAPGMVTKVYDLSLLFPTNCEPGDFLSPLESVVPVFQSGYEAPDQVLYDIRDLVGWREHAPGQMILTGDLKLIVRNTPAMIRQVDKAITALKLAPVYRDLRLAFVSGEGCAAAVPADLGFDASLALLRDRKCAVEWITQVSLASESTSRLVGAFSTSYIRQGEGLIATLAACQDPYVRAFTHGLVINLTASEWRGTTCIKCAVRELHLKGWRTYPQNSFPLDLPDASMGSLDRSLFFRGPGTQLVPYILDGSPRALLVEYSGKTVIGEIGREVR
ncbi:MAG: hypothetical protein WC712_02880 [Candidatus Brocadiia bacterium]